MPKAVTTTARMAATTATMDLQAAGAVLGTARLAGAHIMRTVTQLARLAERIRGRGHELIESREPGGSPGAEAIRGLLLEGAQARWTNAGEALLFAAARADHVERTIRPALAAGKWVLCDRFVDSSIAYQGVPAGWRGGDHGRLCDRQWRPAADRTCCSSSLDAAADRTKARDTDGADRTARATAIFTPPSRRPLRRLRRRNRGACARSTHRHSHAGDRTVVQASEDLLVTRSRP